MAHAYYHAKSSARRFGGTWQDYMPLHEWMDHTKAHIGDNRHRLLLHNTWGIFLLETVFGRLWYRASDGVSIPTRPILEQHVLEDLGFIPSLKECFASVPVEPWTFNRARPLSQEDFDDAPDETTIGAASEGM